MASELKALFQAMRLTKVRKVVVTTAEAAAGDETGSVREIRVFGEPVNGDNPTPLFTLRLVGDTADLIAIKAPEQAF
jgi:hypothetical protein